MRLPLTALLLASCTVATFAADDAATPKSGAREALKARLAAEEAKAKNGQPTTSTPAAPTTPSSVKSSPAPAPAATPAPSTATTTLPVSPSAPTTKGPASTSSATAKKGATPAPAKPAATSASASANTAAAPQNADEAALLLPQVDVKRDPIEIKEQYDRIYEQEKKILAEKRKTKATEADKALNDPRVSKALSIFGGESSDHRASVAQERVRLMEDEKDLMEALVLVKTPEEKKEIQKQIDELKALRRDLEKAMR